tara:strand:+ start:845 stop:961 length:117 start_codon:yes stop_codon:yes gene_type:complete
VKKGGKFTFKKAVGITVKKFKGGRSKKVTLKEEADGNP